jgi:putative transposase
VKPYLPIRKIAVAEGDEQKMPQSLVKILLHVVFSTKNRIDLIHREIESELYAYIHGIVENQSSKLLLGNGTADHGHLLISMGKTIDVSDLVGHIKRDSSAWMKKHDRSFYWQEGYGAFSVGESQVPRVMKYIAAQKEHHAKQDFQGEFLGLLEKYRVEYDERYVWD